MKYKDYLGQIIYDDEAKLFHGQVIGISDMITFEGSSVKELENAFKDSVEDYIEFCEQMGKKPQKSKSGQVRIRINPKLHAKLVEEADILGMSLNSFIEKKLSS